jgi:hypothetical protein
MAPGTDSLFVTMPLGRFVVMSIDLSSTVGTGWQDGAGALLLEEKVRVLTLTLPSSARSLKKFKDDAQSLDRWMFAARACTEVRKEKMVLLDGAYGRKREMEDVMCSPP